MQPEDQSVHEGDSVVLRSLATGSDDITYQWCDGKPFPFKTQSYLNLPDANRYHGGEYFARVKAPQACLGGLPQALQRRSEVDATVLQAPVRSGRKNRAEANPEIREGSKWLQRSSQRLYTRHGSLTDHF